MSSILSCSTAAILAGLLVVGTSVAQQPQAGPDNPPPDSGRPLLDEQLLEDLAPPANPQTTRPAEPSAGEDLGQAGQTTPLALALEHMRAAHGQLVADDPSTAAQRQRQALEQLALAMAQAQRSSQSNSQRQARSSTPEEAGGGEDQQPEGAAAGADPMGESSGARGSGTSTAAGGAPAMRERNWGHLPERVRQQLQSAAIERFLPQYEELIEEYYRRLAEQPEAPAGGEPASP